MGARELKHAFAKAEVFFKSGKDLGKKSVYAFHSLATHEFWGLWDYKNANQSLQKALEINPMDTDVHECLAEIHTSLGDFTSALTSIDRSLQTNPLSPNHYYTKANIFYLQGHYDTAQKLLNRSLEIDPNFALSIQLKLATFIHKAERENMRAFLSQQHNLIYPELYEILYDLLYKERTYDRSFIIQFIQKLQALQPRPLMPWDLFLMVQFDRNEAVKLLCSKVEQKMGQVINFKHEKFLEPLRKQTEYNNLVKKTFPDNSLTFKPERPQPIIRPKEYLTESETEHFLIALKNKMQPPESVYLNAKLTLRSLAEMIDLHPNKLSWLLNEKIGKNFNDYVNGYRLKAFQKKATDPNNSHFTLLGLAYESGFNSKSVFNDFFKKSTGLTPKEWVKKNI
ncbi:tetratricopeptide repeat protein [Mangrovivirga cuniculi]|uniref:HTH araC/xylS-type domain-containing protein n=1 Tax=Mangrovivirga cuniculi TaxID=2715131 RepID=A0A4D7JTQ8_9BACT|nr:tetratricopeptide repeat protein [Mangrovivirga cuniculi]QCK14285.1 hypothetical protein DCC35_05760 [Mangrovivirga cuniculi]